MVTASTASAAATSTTSGSAITASTASGSASEVAASEVAASEVAASTNSASVVTGSTVSAVATSWVTVASSSIIAPTPVSTCSCGAGAFAAARFSSSACNRVGSTGVGPLFVGATAMFSNSALVACTSVALSSVEPADSVTESLATLGLRLRWLERCRLPWFRLSFSAGP